MSVSLMRAFLAALCLDRQALPSKGCDALDSSHQDRSLAGRPQNLIATGLTTQIDSATRLAESSTTEFKDYSGPLA